MPFSHDELLQRVVGWLIGQRRLLEADAQRFVRRVAKLTPEVLRGALNLPGYVQQESSVAIVFASDLEADRALRVLALAVLEPGSSREDLVARVDALTAGVERSPDRRPAALVLHQTADG